MKTYIKDHYRYYLVYLVIILLFDLILLLCDISISLLYYPTCLCFFLVIVYFIYREQLENNGIPVFAESKTGYYKTMGVMTITNIITRSKHLSMLYILIIFT